MGRIRNWSIKYKLTALTAVTMTLALAACCTLFVSKDINMMRDSKVQQLTSVAEILARNSTAALSFQQRHSAETLLESLSDRETIMAAWVVDDSGDVFAEFKRYEHLSCPDVSAEQRHLYADDGTLYVWTPITEDDVPLGTMVIQDSVDDLHAQISGVIVITIYVLLICIVIGLSVSFPLNRFLTRPILELATTAQRVSQTEDFDIRAKHDSFDEIGVLYREFNNMLVRIKERDDVIQRAHRDLQDSNDQLEERVHLRTQMLELANQKLKQEMQQKELASQALHETKDELMEASRKAGMADVANSVLHNVGNVLNSLNVSSAVITQRVGEMRISKLQQCIGMVLDHQGDLTEFLTNDDRGKIIPNYLPGLVDNITTDQQQILCELESLTKNVEHIKDIVRAQQSHAGTFGVIEMCRPQELMEDALQFSMDSIKRHRIDLVRDYVDIEEVQIEKARLLQILVNLIKNAKESVLSSESVDRRVTLRIRDLGERVQYSVIDTGLGIDPSMLMSIFSHGFTTKSDGHGFGLHASANFAREMGGELRVHSEGIGSGAAFIIELPKWREKQVEVQARLASNQSEDGSGLPAGSPVDVPSPPVDVSS